MSENLEPLNNKTFSIIDGTVTENMKEEDEEVKTPQQGARDGEDEAAAPSEHQVIQILQRNKCLRLQITLLKQSNDYINKMTNMIQRNFEEYKENHNYTAKPVEAEIAEIPESDEIRTD